VTGTGPVRRTLLLALLAGAAGLLAPAAPAAQPLPEDTTFAPGDAAGRERAARALAHKAAADDATLAGPPRVLLFARVPGSARAVTVPDTTQWPEEMEAAYNLVRDTSGRVLALVEIPTSLSGDWFNAYTHYFDERGRTAVFERFSGFFNGCENGGAREHSLYVLDDGGRVIEKAYVLTDFEDEPLDPRGCTFHYRHPYRIHPSWLELAAALGLDP
jgi:hypothetical protein